MISQIKIYDVEIINYKLQHLKQNLIPLQIIEFHFRFS